MTGIVVATIVGSLAYMVWSMRRFLRGFRDIIYVNTGEGTITTRLLPNLSFAALFFLLVYHCFLVDSHTYLGLPENMNLVTNLSEFNQLVSSGLPVYDMDSGKTIRIEKPRPMSVQVQE